MHDGWHVGADIGGTFTDIVLERGGTRHSLKLLTTHGAPEEAVLNGISQVCAAARINPGEISTVIHGTTLATNALIERRGAKTALITTKGFRDVIEMRTESRFEQYDLNLVLPEPLIERQDRLVLDERVGAQGQILKPLQTRELAGIIETLRGGAYTSIAVGFLHAYLNDAHEQAAKAAIQTALPDVAISLSSEVSPQMREYERFNTVCANAYVKPLMAAYLARLEAGAKALGISAQIFLMHSGGGILGLETAREFPVRLVESGPAGGAIFAADLAARHGLKRVLSYDMGGTTAKICLIKDQAPKTARVFEVARTYRFKKGSGMPISIPVIDMVEIGAGGGSIAHIDDLGQIRVGPQSAGSEPGPACYQRGGTLPAVTDADLLLGKLDPDDFAGGSISLSTQKAETAIIEQIGAKLTLPATAAAFGIGEVVDENMANAARMHGVENGEDLANYTMIAFGGAAPIHAARLCQKLGINRFIVPPGAGVGSAIGFLRAPISFETTRSVYLKMSEFRGQAVKSLLDELQSEATAFVRQCAPNAAIQSDARVYMRYIGQGWEIPVELTAEDLTAPVAGQFQARFEAAYTQLFGRIVHGLEIEITGWAVKASTILPAVPGIAAPSNEQTAASSASRALFDPTGQTMVEAAVYGRDALRAGDTMRGPAIITEAETSIIIPNGFAATMLMDGSVSVSRATQGERP